MIRIIAVALCIAATAATAQSFISLPDSPKGGTPVASPNRTISAQLAAAIPPGAIVARLGSTIAAPVWVDSAGKIVGRNYASGVALTTYNNKPLGILLSPHYSYDANGTPIAPLSGGMSLNGSSGTFFYTSTDCSGTPYLYESLFGVQQVGASMRDPSDSQAYVYIIDQTDWGAQPVTTHSYFHASQCYVYSQQSVFFPVAAVVPASYFAAPGAIWIK